MKTTIFKVPHINVTLSTEEADLIQQFLFSSIKTRTKGGDTLAEFASDLVTALRLADCEPSGHVKPGPNKASVKMAVQGRQESRKGNVAFAAENSESTVLGDAVAASKAAGVQVVLGDECINPTIAADYDASDKTVVK